MADLSPAAEPHEGVPSRVYLTERGTPYLTQPGVSLLARPSFDRDSLGDFLSSFASDLGFDGYVRDPVVLDDGASLCKTAGQLCYMSFGPRRTGNADAARYFANILQSGHGSVLEHACYTVLLYGISRSLTHELVRHRAGFAYSQVSQRYVSGRVLRFVERPEFRANPELHRLFVERIDRAAAEYAALESALADLQREGDASLASASSTGTRKRVHQAARALLPNETEAPIIVTGNARAWRHFVEARASEHADVEIRVLAVAVYRCLLAIEPLLFNDYAIADLPDGTSVVSTANPKV